MSLVRRFTAASFIVSCLASTETRAQGDVEGRVLADSTRRAVAGAEVRLPRIGRTTLTDSGGRFSLSGVSAGRQLLVIRALGYRPESILVEVFEAQIVVHEFSLKRLLTVLGEVKITAEAIRARMTGFDHRRQHGVGRFLDRETLSKVENRNTSTVLASVPGLAIYNGTGNRAWAFTTRAVSSGQCALCAPLDNLDRADIQAGARSACYMDVYVDGVLVYRHDAPPPNTLFNVNSVPVEQIEGIEVYTSTSQIPAEFNRTGSGCGVLLIWTR